MVMYNPPHPGEAVREFCIEPLGLSVTEAAKGLGVSRSGQGKSGAIEQSLFTGLRLWRFLFTAFQRAPRRTLMPLNWMHIKSWLRCS